MLLHRMAGHTMKKNKLRLLELIKRDAYEEGKQTKLSSGEMSNFYVDAKMVTLNPEGAYLTAKILLDILKDDNVDGIGGLTMGADPIVGAIAAISHIDGHPISAFIVRKTAKEHGKKRWIEGQLPKNARVVIIDDVATTGISLLHAINTVKKEMPDCEIVKVVSLVDRLEGARDTLKKEGYELTSVFSREDLRSEKL